MRNELVRKEHVEMTQQETFMIGSLENMRIFKEAYLTGMSRHFSDKGDLERAKNSMQTRLVGLQLDMGYADLFKLGFQITATVKSNGDMEMEIINPENSMRKKFLSFEYHNKQAKDIEPTEGHQWFYTQAFVEAGSFLRGIAFIKNEK